MLGLRGVEIPKIHSYRFLIMASTVREVKSNSSQTSLMTFLTAGLLMRLQGLEKKTLKKRTKSYQLLIMTVQGNFSLLDSFEMSSSKAWIIFEYSSKTLAQVAFRNRKQLDANSNDVQLSIFFPVSIFSQASSSTFFIIHNFYRSSLIFKMFLLPLQTVLTLSSLYWIFVATLCIFSVLSFFDVSYLLALWLGFDFLFSMAPAYVSRRMAFVVFFSFLGFSSLFFINDSKFIRSQCRKCYFRLIINKL